MRFIGVVQSIISVCITSACVVFLNSFTVLSISAWLVVAMMTFVVFFLVVLEVAKLVVVVMICLMWLWWWW